MDPLCSEVAVGENVFFLWWKRPGHNLPEHSTPSVLIFSDLKGPFYLYSSRVLVFFSFFSLGQFINLSSEHLVTFLHSAFCTFLLPCSLSALLRWNGWCSGVLRVRYPSPTAMYFKLRAPCVNKWYKAHGWKVDITKASTLSKGPMHIGL